MTVIQQGSVNTNALTVPDLYIQIVPPSNAFVNGVPTNKIGFVGTASWGATNSPTTFGSINEYVQNFGPVLTNKFDMGSHVAAAVLQFANNMIGVRVSDGTDMAASANVLDSTTGATITGINLTAFYTGTVGNTINAVVGTGSNTSVATPTYKITLIVPNGVPEVFDNIGGTGAALWQNMINAINMGQSGIRGPSQLCVASLGSGVSNLVLTAPGSGFTSMPTAAFTGGGGTGAQAKPIAKVGSATVASAGTGYVVGDTITLAGGTNTAPCVLTVATVTSGGVATFTVTNGGSYTVMPTSPVAQATTSGVGVGATFTISGLILTGISEVSSGTGYTSNPTLTITGGGGTGATATAGFGSSNAPAINTYVLSGGTNGISGVTETTLLGVDTTPRTGMYALRSSQASIVDLCDNALSTTFSTQIAYGLSEGSYMMLTGPAGQTPAAGVTVKQTAGLDSYAFKLLLGDWVYWQDIYNGVTRLISPQGFAAGVLANLSPEQSSLNKQIFGIVGTQKSYSNQNYSTADLALLAQNGLDVICNPVPGGAYFGMRIGHNGSSNQVINGDNYTRLTNYIAYTLNTVLGQYVGQLQSASERLNAQNTLQSFLSNMEQQGMIGDVNGGPAYQVVLDATNNPPARVALGYQQADVKVIYLSVIQYFLVNVEGGQSVTVQTTNTVSTAA